MKRHLGVVIAGTAALLAPAILTAPAEAAGSLRSAISLTGPKYGTYGSTAKLTGTLWRNGTTTRIAGATVHLQRAAHGKNVWGNLKSARTSSSGTFIFYITLSGAFDYRAVYGGSATYTTAVSGKVYPLVLRKVLLDSIRTTDHGGETPGTLRATGRVVPVLPKGAPVYLQRYNKSNKTWTSIGISRATGSVSIAVSAKVRGSIASYRLHTPTRYPYIAGTSRTVTFAHYVWRGVHHKPILGSGGSGNPEYHIYKPSEPNGRYRSVVELGADIGGSSWVDVNTSGCLLMDHRGYNYTHQYTPTRVRVGVLKGTTFLRYVDLAPDQSRWLQDIRLTGLTRTRIQLWDLGRTGEPLSFNVSWVLCNN